MEEERRRKIIIDSARAMARAVGCMDTTLLFRRSATTAAMVQEFRSRCEDVAKMAGEIEAACGADREAHG